MIKKIFTLALFTLLPVVALAAPSTYSLLAPLGLLSGSVTLDQYLKGIVQVTIGVAGILAVVMTVICGIQLIGSPSVSQKSASKDCITSAIFGLLLAISSWLILNTINTQLLSSDVALLGLPAIATTPTATTTAANAPRPTFPGFYFRYKDSATGPILNSPQWPDTSSCEEGVAAAALITGRVIEIDPSSNKPCFQVYAPAPGVPKPKPGDPPVPPPAGEAAARTAFCGNTSCINQKPLGVNNPVCPYAGAKNCTNLDGLPNASIATIKALQAASGSNVVISGGTEAGHSTKACPTACHKPGNNVFDLRFDGEDSALTKKIMSGGPARASFKGNMRWLYNGFWYTDEKSATTRHWHVCIDGASASYCKP